MRNQILIKSIILIFTIYFLSGCNNKDIKPKIIKITPEKYLALQSKIDKKTIIHFWSSYCHPCIKDFPQLTRIAKEKNINIINISSDKSDSKLQDNLERVMNTLNVTESYIIDFNNLYPDGTNHMDVLGQFAKKINLKDYNNPLYIVIDANAQTLFSTYNIKELEEKLQ